MEELEHRVELGRLLDLYGPLLSERTASLMAMYIDEDFSLSEIAQTNGVSRQSVYDAVRRCEEQLTEMEQKLGLRARLDEISAGINRCKAVLDRAELSPADRLKELSAMLCELEQQI